MPRKRARDETELDSSILSVEQSNDNPIVHQLRNMWQFASFMQYLHFFGSVVKVDEDLDIEDLEDACTDPEKSGQLAQIGLQLLKYVSSHRGLTPQLFDEYTRRQYLAKAPQRNPFGEEEEPKKFNELDVFDRIRVLHQLSVWTFGNVDRVRSLMPEEKESELTQWRIEPFGWDADDRIYFLLDDDRLYRQTEAPLPPTPVKAKAKPKPRRSRGTRSSKRRKLSTPDDEVDGTEENDETVGDIKQEENQDQDDGFGGMTWECIAVTLQDYQTFLESIRKSRDPNEKMLHKAVTDTVLPILEKKAEAQRAKALKKQRDLENLQKMATAKRSSRIAGRLEKQKEEEDLAAAERKRFEDLDMARKEQARQKKLEEDRESRMMTREQRLKEREVKRILHEEELARLEEMKARGEDPNGRHSERNLLSQLEKRQRELDELKQEDSEWVFDCSVCGVHGANIDDGTHSIACEKCNIWQHSKCHGIKEEDAESDDFHFVCADCKRKEEDAKKPKIAPLKLGRVTGSQSPAPERADSRPPSNDVSHPGEATPKGRIVTGVSILNPPKSVTRSPQAYRQGGIMNGPSLSPHGQSPGPPGAQHHGPYQVGVPQPIWHGAVLPPPQRPASYSHSPPHATHVQPSVYPPPHNASPSISLHHQAHASAVANSPLPHQVHETHLNGNHNGSMPPPSPHHSRPSSSHFGSFSAQRPVSTQSTAGVNSSPTKPRNFSSPSQPIGAQQSPFGMANSPLASFPPPQNHEQRVAGHSPVKQTSPTPQYSHSHSQSPLPVPQHAAATPSSRAIPPASTPMSGILRANPQAASSPIPPIGNGPVIPTKHDTPRPISRDSIGETPVFPPIMALSPSVTQTQHGRGMSTLSGQGGLGTADIPVKKMPEQNGQTETPSNSQPQIQDEFTRNDA